MLWNTLSLQCVKKSSFSNNDEKQSDILAILFKSLMYICFTGP